ncbi:MAG TPA: lysylphosphatidylglycerol synthase domain-containing protein [Actinomycetota bacterium]
MVAAFFAVTLFARWRQVTAVKWHLGGGYFVVACLLLGASYALVAALWGLALRAVAAVRPHPVAGARIWFVSNLARYVPGNVWSFVGAAELARREGVRRRDTLAVMALTQGLSVGVALLVGLPVLLAERSRLGRPALVGTVLLLAAVVLALALWRPLWRRLAVPLLARRYPGLLPSEGGEGGGRVPWPPPLTMVWLGAGYAFYWAVTGLAFAALYRSLFPLAGGDVPLVVAAYAAAYAVGFLSLLTPAGLGVREGVLVVALAPLLPAGPALVVALLSRLWMMLFELLGVAAAWLLERAGQRRSSRLDPDPAPAPAPDPDPAPGNGRRRSS